MPSDSSVASARSAASGRRSAVTSAAPCSASSTLTCRAPSRASSLSATVVIAAGSPYARSWSTVTSSPESATIPPSGEQFELAFGAQRAVVVEVGGGLRHYGVDGRDLLDGYAVDAMCTSGRGQLLLPWPNRIDAGSYEFGGRSHQLPLTEPEHGNAIHGLVRWSSWKIADRETNRVVAEPSASPAAGLPVHARAPRRLHALRRRALGPNHGDQRRRRRMPVRQRRASVPDAWNRDGRRADAASAGTNDSSLRRARHSPRRGRSSKEPTTTSAARDRSAPRSSTPRSPAFSPATTASRASSCTSFEAATASRSGSTTSYRYLMIFTGDPLPDVNRRSNRRRADDVSAECVPIRNRPDHARAGRVVDRCLGYARDDAFIGTLRAHVHPARVMPVA